METHFHVKGYAPRLALKKRYKATQKWPIVSNPHFCGDQEKDEEQQILLPMSGSLKSHTEEISDSSIDALTDVNLPDDELSLDRIIKLHQQSPKISSIYISSEQVTL